jgi:hypothetical protein
MTCVAFPWGNLITAVSTLTAGLGGAGLRARSDRKDRAAEADRDDKAAQAERERLARQATVATATALLRNHRQSIGDYSVIGTTNYAIVVRRTEELTAEFFQAVADAELYGSAEVRESARRLRAVAVASGEAAVNKNVQAAKTALPAFDQALGQFIDEAT